MAARRGDTVHRYVSVYDVDVDGVTAVQSDVVVRGLKPRSGGIEAGDAADSGHFGARDL